MRWTVRLLTGDSGINRRTAKENKRKTKEKSAGMRREMERKKAVCISASNMIHSKSNSFSLKVGKMISEILAGDNISCRIIDLREEEISPCIGCGRCYDKRRCTCDDAFNRIYEEMVKADYLFFISPHYSPIPAKLCMLLEKMEQITFLHWWKKEDYRSELYGKLAGVISHGGGGENVLESYKAMVNDTIANALDTIQVKVVPFNSKWDTGIALPVDSIGQDGGIFPVQGYDWKRVEEMLRAYVEVVVLSSKSSCVII